MTEPRTLPALVAWFREVWESEMPPRLHDHSTTEDDGAPHWHAAFRSYLLSSDWGTDQDGTVRRPIRAHLQAMAHSSGRNMRRARWLFVLACSEWDIMIACQRVEPRIMASESWQDMASDYAEMTLRRFWARCQTEPRRFLPPRRRGADSRIGKSESQSIAEAVA